MLGVFILPWIRDRFSSWRCWTSTASSAKLPKPTTAKEEKCLQCGKCDRLPHGLTGDTWLGTYLYVHIYIYYCIKLHCSIFDYILLFAYAYVNINIYYLFIYLNYIYSFLYILICVCVTYKGEIGFATHWMTCGRMGWLNNLNSGDWHHHHPRISNDIDFANKNMSHSPNLDPAMSWGWKTTFL